ncbi:hypothetical protein RIF29_21574 [Crotalaria pallida]|uniref:Uncharacterized protein n=1 Tax=Crotalaria pallida TaxID=3830 RepID=A0AAN9F5J8_CROPI
MTTWSKRLHGMSRTKSMQKAEAYDDIRFKEQHACADYKADPALIFQASFSFDLQLLRYWLLSHSFFFVVCLFFSLHWLSREGIRAFGFPASVLLYGVHGEVGFSMSRDWFRKWVGVVSLSSSSSEEEDDSSSSSCSSTEVDEAFRRQREYRRKYERRVLEVDPVEVVYPRDWEEKRDWIRQYAWAEFADGRERADFQRMERERMYDRGVPVVEGRCSPLGTTSRGFSGGLFFVTRKTNTELPCSSTGTMPPRKCVSRPELYPAPFDADQYECVDVEPKGVQSHLCSEDQLAEIRRAMLPCPGDATGTSYEVLPCSENDRTCSQTDNNSFFFYTDLIHNLGVTLPFTDLEMRVLNELGLAPSQLHPNTWSFLRAFQKYCRARNLVCTVRLFLWTYNPFVNNKDGVTGRLWVSAKARAHCGLFGMFSESWKHFKPKFFKYKYVGTGLLWFRSETGPKFPLEWTPEFFNRHTSTPQRWSGVTLDADESVTAHHFQTEYRAWKFQIDISIFMQCPDNEVLTKIEEHWSNMSSRAVKAVLDARKRKRSENPSNEAMAAEVSTETTSTDSAPLHPTPPAVIIAPPPPQSSSPSTEVVLALGTPPSEADALPKPPTTLAKTSAKDALIKMSGAEWKKKAEDMACQLKRATTMFTVLAEVADDVADGESPAKKKLGLLWLPRWRS